MFNMDINGFLPRNVALRVNEKLSVHILSLIKHIFLNQNLEVLPCLSGTLSFWFWECGVFEVKIELIIFSHRSHAVVKNHTQVWFMMITKDVLNILSWRYSYCNPHQAIYYILDTNRVEWRIKLQVETNN